MGGILPSSQEEVMSPARSRYLRCSLSGLAALWLALGLPTGAQAQDDTADCGSLENNFGPLDYRTERGANLKMVEEYHFTPQVEALVHGVTAPLGSDLDYTLRAYPNHPKALLAMMKLGERSKSPMAPDARYTVECYFERAIRFRKDDTTVRLLYAIYLFNKSRAADATKQLDIASVLAKDNPFTQYNIGLVYLDHGVYARALAQAHRAMAMGFTRPELKKRLMAAGKWTEPAAAGDSAPSASATSANMPTPEAAASAPD